MAATYHRTAYAVCEITLACNLGCIHRGSRAYATGNVREKPCAASSRGRSG